jgi:formate hydrogenlyase transcriptional activator
MQPTQEKSLTSADERLIATAAMFREESYIDWLVELTGEKVRLLLSVMEKAVQAGWFEQIALGIYKTKKLPIRYTSYFSLQDEEQLHIRIVDILSKEYNEGTLAIQSLVYHLLRIRNGLENCLLLVKAGDIYLQLYQNEQALQCYKKATEDLARQSGYEADILFIRATIKYSRISTARHHNQMVQSLLQEALDRAKRQNQPYYTSLLLMHQAKNEWLGSRYEGALVYFEKGWESAKKLNDPKLLRSATTFSTFFLYWQGRFREAVQNFENPVQNVEKFLEGRFPIIAATTVAQCYAFTGNVRQALGMLDTMFEHCMQKGDLSVAANVEGTIGSIMLQIRHMDDALRYFNGSMEKAIKKDNYFLQILLKLSLAYSYYIIGDKKRALSFLEDFLIQSEKVKCTVQVYPYLMELSIAMKEGKLPKIKGVSAETEINRNIEGKNVFLKGLAYRYQAQAIRNADLPAADVVESLTKSIEYIEKSGHQIEIGISQLELGRQYMLMNMDDQAKPHLSAGTEALADLDDAVIPLNLRLLLAKPKPEGDLSHEMVRLGQEIMTFRNHKELIQNIVGTVNRITGAERGGIFLVERAGEKVSLYPGGSKNITIEQTKHDHFSQSLKLIKNTARSRKPCIKEFEVQNSPDNLSYGQIRSCICIPMILRDKVVGVLYNDNRLIKSAIKESRLDLLFYFAALAALALENARIYEQAQRVRQIQKKKYQFYEKAAPHNLNSERIIGESPAMLSVLNKISQVSQTDSTVLILGETGVGKELVASAIHHNSKRADKQFIRVICNAFPDSLISSELFGHEKGAFTGADRKRIGRFELADGGTILLDEIGDLPAEIQVQLLRVLQTREFERIGSSKTIQSDFRLILATNRDLEKEVAAGRFRSDLYYRISVFPIVVPPLRDRKDDIALLSHYFLKTYSDKFGKNFQYISNEELEKLVSYDWPGNVRELENVIEQGVIVSLGNNFKVPESIILNKPQAGSQLGHFTLMENERAHILWALQKTGWKVRGHSGAAELLDIHPSTLNFRMKKHGIERPKNTIVKRIRNTA